jgi:hypothetical protein
MKAALFNPIRYSGSSPAGWPVAPGAYDLEIGQRSILGGLENLQLADELGFDWVTVAEHHTVFHGLSAAPMLWRPAGRNHVLGHIRQTGQRTIGDRRGRQLLDNSM